MSVTETPFFFGDEHQLFGILSEPTDMEPRKTGVLILNSGLVHRSGPFRMGVEIARELTARGFPVLRFDQSARGDSERRSGVTVVEAANLDIDLAKDALRSNSGVESVVLAGLCSGADDALRHIASADDVVGSLLMDPFAPRTSRFLFHHVFPRVLSLPKWFRFISRKIAAAKESKEEGASVDLGAIREFPTHEETCAAFRKMHAQGGASLCVFTGGVSYYYNHKGQLVQGFSLQDIRDGIEEVFFKSAEHTYPLKFHRDQLVATIADFCARRFK